MKEYQNVVVQCKIPFVADCQDIPFTKGIKTGSREAGEIYNLLVEEAMADLVVKWKANGFGFNCPNTETYVTHLWWVDNCFLLASNVEQWFEMAADLTMVIWDKFRWNWKPKSLEIMAINMDISEDFMWLSLPFRHPRNLQCFTVKQAIQVLGGMLDAKGSDNDFLSFRLSQGSKSLYTSWALFKTKAPLTDKLFGYVTGPRACARFLSGLFHINNHSLDAIRKWELQHLRRILKLRRAPDEHYHIYKQRTALKIRKWMSALGHQTFPEVAMSMVFRSTVKALKNSAISHSLREHRSQQWWSTTLTWPPQKRYKAGIKKSRQGAHSAHEDPFVEVWGEEWRTTLASLLETTSIKTLEKTFIQHLAARHSIKTTGDYGRRNNAMEESEERKSARVMSQACPQQKVTMADIHWDKVMEVPQVEIVMDCQPVVEGLLGNYFLKTPSRTIQENLERTMNILAKGTLRAAFLPRQGCLAPVVWRPRESNKLADFLANKGLHEAADSEVICWETWDWLRDRKPMGMQCFVDGGFDERLVVSSIGMFLRIFVTNEHGLWVSYDVARVSKYFSTGVHTNSLEIESTALKEAAELIAVMTRLSVNES